MVDDKHQIMSIIKKVCFDIPEISLCILYGSAATGNLKKSSDFDLAILSERDSNPEKRLELSLELEKQLGRRISVINIQSASGIFLREVLVKGIILKNTKPQLLTTKVLEMLYFTEDWLPYVRMSLQNKVKDFAIGK